MQYFYSSDLSGKEFEFNEEESKHCIRVLRKKSGDQIHLIDGKGLEVLALIDQDNPKKCSGHFIEKIVHPRNRNYYLHLAIAPTKNFDRMEWMLEKAVEIGVDEISFMDCENSERAKVNLDRCEKIAISAIKQSKQFYLPQLNPIQKIAHFLKNQTEAVGKWIAWCPSSSADSLIKKLPEPLLGNFVVLVGPEGDFSSQEIQLAQESGFHPVSLGPNILRSETAGLQVVSAFAHKSQLL